MNANRLTRHWPTQTAHFYHIPIRVRTVTHCCHSYFGKCSKAEIRRISMAEHAMLAALVRGRGAEASSSPHSVADGSVQERVRVCARLRARLL